MLDSSRAAIVVLHLWQVACGGDHSLALGEGGEVFAWGRGSWGQTGHNSSDSVNAPLQIEALASEHIVQATSCWS